MFRSIRARTTLAATVVMALALVVAGLVVLSVLRTALLANVEQVAELHAANIAADLKGGGKVAVVDADDDELVQVVDASGRVVASSPNVAGQPPVASLRAAEGERAAVTVDEPFGLEGPFRVVAISVDEPDELTVYVGTSFKQADETVDLLRTVVFFVAPILLALLAVLTWAAVGRGLRPVEAIRAEVAEITSIDLARRVSVPPTGDEVSQLANTMNEMLVRLDDSSQRQRRFVADASHELRTPLATTRAQLEVALDRPDNESWRETASVVLKENAAMEALVADLLYLARTDDGAAQRPRSPVDLHEVVHEEIQRAAIMARIRPDTTNLQPAVVSGRRQELARVIRNLLDNADRHAKSSVCVELHVTSSRAVLTVRDDGQGIPAGSEAQIFQRFTRLDDARARRPSGGAGLGLAIVADIVHQHDGEIAVQSSAAGAHFIVTLPIDE